MNMFVLQIANDCYNFNTFFSSSSIPQQNLKVQHANLLKTLDVKDAP